MKNSDNLLELQKFLLNGGTFEELETAGISVRPKGKLVLFKYAIDTDWSKPYAHECRGVILENETWDLVAKPFDKFWNLHEGKAADIDWDTASVMEKLDGSMITLHFYDGKWDIATSGSADAGGNVGDHGITFNDLFWKTVDDNGYKVEHDDLKDYTFIFELTSLLNRIVLPYDKPELTMLAVISIKTLQEECPSKYIERFGTKMAKQYSLKNVKEICDTFEDMSAIEGEGYVVVDADWRRVKIKNPKYVALHRVIDKMGEKWILESVRLQENSEILLYFPEYKNQFDNISIRYHNLIKTIENEYEDIKDTSDQKEFALKNKHTTCPSALFSVRSGKSKSVAEFLKNINIKTLCRLVHINITHE